MKKFVFSFGLIFFLILIGLPNQTAVEAGGPAAPPTPPTIAVSPESVDCESVKFVVTIASRNNTLTSCYLKYRIGGDPTVLSKAVPLLDPSLPIRVTASSLPADTDIHYWAELNYGTTGKVTTAEATVRTYRQPTVAVSMESIDSVSITLRIKFNPNGHQVTSRALDVNYHDTPHRLALDDSMLVGPDDYRYRVADLDPELFIQYKGYLTFQTNIGSREIWSETGQAFLSPLPVVQFALIQVDFTGTSWSMMVTSNGHTVVSGGLEWRQTSSQPWQPELMWPTNPGTLELTGLPQGSTVQVRGYLIYVAGGDTREIRTDVSTVQLYKIQTLSERWGWLYMPVSDDGNLTVFANVSAFQVYPTDIALIEQGFVWSEKSTPVLDGNHRQVTVAINEQPSGPYDFNAVLEHLVVGQTYYYRAYAKGEDGSAHYGSIVKFRAFITDVGYYIPVISPGAVIYPTQATATTATATSAVTTAATETSESLVPTPVVVTPEVSWTTVPATAAPTSSSAAVSGEPSPTPAASEDPKDASVPTSAALPLVIALSGAALLAGTLFLILRRRK